MRADPCHAAVLVRK